MCSAIHALEMESLCAFTAYQKPESRVEITVRDSPKQVREVGNPDEYGISPEGEP
jgi:hypothetical protein